MRRWYLLYSDVVQGTAVKVGFLLLFSYVVVVGWRESSKLPPFFRRVVGAV